MKRKRIRNIHLQAGKNVPKTASYHIHIEFNIKLIVKKKKKKSNLQIKRFDT